ncbi:hypothetical protein RRG08_000082 [Elysia crispata]|uniref:Uncharacterized protein n=1 Tax=Elysia crispata TaxID=231223 RepID=A0AAE1DR29_9GAST|nr:hypothetical protein RRG08_000082 [Elysia crispata]
MRRRRSYINKYLLAVTGSNPGLDARSIVVIAEAWDNGISPRDEPVRKPASFTTDHRLYQRTSIWKEDSIENKFSLCLVFKVTHPIDSISL